MGVSDHRQVVQERYMLVLYVYVIVVSWFLRHLTCTDRPYKADRQISFGAIL